MTRIMTNVSAINGERNLAKTGLKMGKTLEKLASGYRINRAADDAAGLAISEKMRAQILVVSQDREVRPDQPIPEPAPSDPAALATNGG